MKRLMWLIVFGLTFVSCNQNLLVPGAEGDVIQVKTTGQPTVGRSGEWYVHTVSTGEKLDLSIIEKLKTTKQLIHTFSNGKEIVLYNQDSGDARSEGDILITRSEKLPEFIVSYEKRIADAKAASARGVGLNPNGCSLQIIWCWTQTRQYLWRNKIVAYQFDTNLSPGQIAAVSQAINAWNSSSMQVKFVPFINYNSPWVRFTLGGLGCGSSYVGNNNAIFYNLYLTGQNITLNCFNNGTVQHEMGHAVGLWHEQQRCDRDNFILVNSTDDVNNGKRCGSDILQYGLYDYTSLMEYAYFTSTDGSYIAKKSNPPVGQFYGDPNNSDTLTSPISVGQRFGIGIHDKESVNYMYQLCGC